MFCPLLLSLSLNTSIISLVITTTLFGLLVINLKTVSIVNSVEKGIRKSLLPSLGVDINLFFSFFLVLRIFNLISLIVFSYPVTTTLSFNIRAALILWLMRILFLTQKINWVSSLLPSNSPWYLVPFLSLVEIIRIGVRPITLCFRLLANITAGHILLALICKLPYYSWLLGVLFGLLELLVSLVQAFVFLILVRVYLEESLRH